MEAQGVDTFFVYNVLDPTPTTSVFTASSFTADAGPTNHYTGMEQVIASARRRSERRCGSWVQARRLTSPPATATTRSASATATSTPTLHSTSRCQWTAAQGDDQIRLDDLNDTTAGDYNDYVMQVVGGADRLRRRTGDFSHQWAARLRETGMESATLDAGNIDDIIEVQNTVTPLRS